MNRFTNPDQAEVPGNWAVSLAFITNGLLSGTWISRLPAVRERLHVSDGVFGAALLGGAVGSLLALVVASRTCRRFGVRRTYTAAVGAWALLYAAAACSPGAITLFWVLLVIGVANGVFAVVSNAVGHNLEVRSGRPLLPKYHGLFSVGALTGSFIGSQVAGHVGARAHIVAASGMCAVLTVVAARFLPTDGVVSTTPRRALDTPPRSWRATVLSRSPGRLIVLGAGGIALCATLGEGTSNNWAAIFLRENRGMTEGMAAAGFAVYAAAMACGRLGGNVVAARIPRSRLLRLEAVLLGGGALLLVATHSPVTLFAAMAAWGLGVAVLFPTAMSVAATALDEPATGISQASLIGFTGFLAGPPLVGAMADSFGLGVALLILVPVAVGVWLLAPLARVSVHRAEAVVTDATMADLAVAAPDSAAVAVAG